MIFVVLGVGAKVLYDIYMPKIVGDLLEKNIASLLGNENTMEELLGIIENEANSTETKDPEVEVLTPSENEQQPASPPSSTPKKTYASYSTAQLEAAARKTTDAERAQIIEIAKGCVPTAEIPKMVDLYRQNPNSAIQYGTKFLTPAAKSQMFAIVVKYLE